MWCHGDEKATSIFFLLQVKETGNVAIVGAYVDLVSSSMQLSAMEPKVGKTRVASSVMASRFMFSYVCFLSEIAIAITFVYSIYTFTKKPNCIACLHIANICLFALWEFCLCIRQKRDLFKLLRPLSFSHSYSSC